MTEAIDVVVIGGYLGAGKTSLVNHLLRTGTGRRTLVLVNDFGKVAVEDELVASRDAEMLTLTNGCVCCSMASPLIDTFTALRERPDPPELLVLETSGVADPEPVSHYAMIPGFRLVGVVVVADAETVRGRAGHELVGRTVRRQLAAAGLLVLNKTDLVAPEDLPALRAWLADEAPQAAVVEASHGAVPAALVVGPDLLPSASSPASDDDGHRHGDHEDDHLADHRVDTDPHRTVTWYPDGPVHRDDLLAVLTDPATGIVRAKGTLRFIDHPDQSVMVQAVGRRVNLSPVDTGNGDRLVLIGVPPEFDAADVRVRLASGLSP